MGTLSVFTMDQNATPCPVCLDELAKIEVVAGGPGGGIGIFKCHQCDQHYGRKGTRFHQAEKSTTGWLLEPDPI